MRYYLLDKPELFDGEVEIINFYQQLDYRVFSSDRMYQMPSRITFQIRHKERIEYPPVLLEPLPLFNKMAWNTIQSFMKKPLHTHFIFIDEKTKDIHHYFCPSFRRVKCRQVFGVRQDGMKEVKIYSEEAFPDGLPVLYLDDGNKILVLMRLDILESLMRKDLCDIRLLPVRIMEEQNYAG